MFPILAHIRPLDLRTGLRVDIRVGSSPGSAAMGLGGFRWEPAFMPTGRPSGSIELMALDLAPGIRTATSNLKLQVAAIKVAAADQLYWVQAPITIYRADELVWPAAIEFDGIVTKPQRGLDDGSLALSCSVSAKRLDRDLLTATFNGDGFEGGDAAKYGALRPFGAGHCYNVPLEFFDTVRNIAQIDGYGNTIAIDTLLEGLSDMGPAFADYASFALLAAAIDGKTIKPGMWATCVAEGLIGLGAPAVAKMTCHARFEHGMSGALTRYLMVERALIPVDLVLEPTMAALDVAVPFPIHYWTADQVKIRDLVEQIAAGCNATPLVTFQGKFAVTRPFAGETLATIERGIRSDIEVTEWQISDPIDPIWQMKMRTARPAYVSSRDEILFADDFVPRGLFNILETYRAGHTVWTNDGAEWLFIADEPAVGHAPPASPVTVDAYWQRLRPPTKEQLADSYAAAQAYNPDANYSRGDQVSAQNARWMFISTIAWDHATAPPALPLESNDFWTLIRDASPVSIRTSITSATIQADYQSIPSAGQLPLGGRGILAVGSVDVSAAAAWSVATSGCDATIEAGGAFLITAVRAIGYVDVKAVYATKTYSARVTVTLNNAAPPADGGGATGGGGGGGGASASLTTFPTVSSDVYPAAPTATAQITATAGGLSFSGTFNYSAAPRAGGKAPGSAQLLVKVVYRVAGSGSGWTDAGPEQTGTVATASGAPEYDFEYGNLDFSGINPGGLTAGTIYEFGVICRRVGDVATAPNGVLTGTAL